MTVHYLGDGSYRALLAFIYELYFSETGVCGLANQAEREAILAANGPLSPNEQFFVRRRHCIYRPLAYFDSQSYDAAAAAQSKNGLVPKIEVIPYDGPQLLADLGRHFLQKNLPEDVCLALEYAWLSEDPKRYRVICEALKELLYERRPFRYEPLLKLRPGLRVRRWQNVDPQLQGAGPVDNKGFNDKALEHYKGLSNKVLSNSKTLNSLSPALRAFQDLADSSLFACLSQLGQIRWQKSPNFGRYAVLSGPHNTLPLIAERLHREPGRRPFVLYDEDRRLLAVDDGRRICCLYLNDGPLPDEVQTLQLEPFFSHRVRALEAQVERPGAATIHKQLRGLSAFAC